MIDYFLDSCLRRNDNVGPSSEAQGEELNSIFKDSILCYGVYMIVVDGKCLEGVGVEPDIVVPFDVRFSAGRDVQLERAKDEMVKVIEASHLSLWENHKRVTTSCIKGFLLKCVINDTQWVMHDTVNSEVTVTTRDSSGPQHFLL